LSKHPKNYKKQIDMITKTQRKIKSNFSINNEHLKGTRHHTSKKKTKPNKSNFENTKK